MHITPAEAWLRSLFQWFGITDHFIRQPTSESLCQFGSLLFAGIDHVDRTTIPRMFESKRYDFPDTNESQPEFDIPAQILEPGLRYRLKFGLVALPSNECDKCLLDVERGAVAPTVERKQHIALATQVDQLLQLVREREIPHRHPHDDAISPLEARRELADFLPSSDLGRCHRLARNTFVLRVYRLCVELRKPFLPDVQCVDDDVVCLRYIFVKKSFDERARSRLIFPRRGRYVQDMHDIALRLYCG